jgi:hypothetical protein
MNRQTSFQRAAGNCRKRSRLTREARRADSISAIQARRAPMVEVMICNVRDVRDARVRDIHIPEITPAHVIPREERLAEAQRAPAKSTTITKSETGTPATPAPPGDESRGVPGPHPVRSRSPTPVAAPGNPTAIVEGSKAPRIIVDPGPSPRINPAPVPVAVRSPTRTYRSRHPDRAVLRRLTPGSILVKPIGQRAGRGSGTTRRIHPASARCGPRGRENCRP